jgi:nucleotide-binding universal stress UspA family protein
VAYAVADAVRRHHPALVVLGRPDYSGTPDELVHTTSLDILRAALCPMLVVPHTVHSTAPPRRVLLAVDGDEFTLGGHTGSVRRLLSALAPELTVLHVADQDGAPETTAALDSVLHTGLTVELPPVQTLTVVAPHPAGGILQAAKAGKYDMIMLVARRRSFLGKLFHCSVTAEVLLHSKLPVLVLPAE